MRDTTEAIAGYVLFGALLTGGGVVVGFSVESALTTVLAVCGVVVSGECGTYLVARSSLLEAVDSLFTGVALLVVCTGAIVVGESALLIAFMAFAGGWLVNDAVRSLRTTSNVERT